MERRPTIPRTLSSIGGTNSLTLLAGTANGNSLGNGITVGAGAGTLTINAPLILGGSNTFTNNSSNAIAITSPISGAFPLSFSGTGGAILTGTSTYSGITSIGTGFTLQVGNGTAASGSINSTSAIVDSGALLFALGGNAATNTYGQVISGGGNVVMGGPGLLTLGGANSFTGGLILNSGTVSATTSANALGGSGTGTVSLASGASATLLGDSRTFANPLILSGGTLTLGQTAGTNNGPTFSGGVTGTGTLFLTTPAAAR